MSSLKISEVKGYGEDESFSSITDTGKIYGVEIDEPTFSCPEWVREIGIILKSDGDDGIEDDTLDAALSFSLKNVHVILEVPFGETVDDEHLFNVAANAGFSLSYLPPLDKSLLPKFYERVCSVAKIFLGKQFFKEVLPVTSYLNYLFYEVYNGKEAAAEFKVDDSYIVGKFVSVMTEEESDEMKAHLRVAIMNHFGGEDMFAGIALKIRENAQKKLVGNLEDMKVKLDAEEANSEGDKSDESTEK